jgi:hypothetical protein
MARVRSMYRKMSKRNIISIAYKTTMGRHQTIILHAYYRKGMLTELKLLRTRKNGALCQ